MKKLITLCLLLLLVLTIHQSVYAQSISGNGNVVKVERDVNPFTSINTTDGWDLVLTQGEAYSLTIETDKNLIDVVKTEVRGNELRIYADKRIIRSKERTIHLTFKNLNRIDASAGADISAKTPITSENNFEINASGGSDIEKLELEANNFVAWLSGGLDAEMKASNIKNLDITANGGSDIELEDLKAQSCKLNINGGSDVELDGSVQNLIINATGGSDIDAYSLEVEHAKLNISGSSDAKLSVHGTLDLKASGGSDFNGRGNPELKNINTCKSCDFNLRGL